jgi:phosphatidate cytidylyltransferase
LPTLQETFGKNKLSPTISPNKTVEGSIGGVIGSFVLTLIFSYLYAKNHMIKLLFLAVLGSLVSQSGDLVASKIKRYTGVKDYGRLIPGHGGILDRFDSIIVTTPVVYYFVRIFIK